MILRRYIVVLLLCLALVGGCKKKQKPTTPPAPSIVPQAQAAPPQRAEKPPTQPQPQEAPAQTTTDQSKTEAKTKPQSRPHKPRPKPSPAQTSSGTEVAKATPPKPIAPSSEGSGLGDISTSMPRTGNDQLSSLTTEQLLKSTEDNLNKIKRALNADEQGIVKHIRGFMTEAKQAMVDGDSVRAHNLALKARLLSQELVTP